MDHESPKIKADKTLRSFRRECQISWDQFTEVWMYISDFVTVPCNDSLFEPSDSVAYKIKLSELTDDLLRTGNFGKDLRGKWVFGQHSPEPHREEFTMFIERMAAYAVRKVMDNIPATAGHVDCWGPQGRKVGQWLTNTTWGQFRTVARQVVDSEDSTYIISNSGASFTMVGNSNGSTTEADTVVYQETINSGGTVIGGQE